MVKWILILKNSCVFLIPFITLLYFHHNQKQAACIRYFKHIIGFYIRLFQTINKYVPVVKTNLVEPKKNLQGPWKKLLDPDWPLEKMLSIVPDCIVCEVFKMTCWIHFTSVIKIILQNNVALALQIHLRPTMHQKFSKEDTALYDQKGP